MIDTTAIIHPSAKLGENVSIGPYAVIGADVEIGDRCKIGPHAVINGPTRIGADTQIFQFSSIGDAPQDKKYKGEPTALEIGERNVIREFCTFNRGTTQDQGVTRIGDDNWIMAYCHVAHDCVVGNKTIFANNAQIAGHVHVGDHAILGAFTVVHQFVAIGAYSFTGMGTILTKDLPPYVMANGNLAKPYGLNSEGMKRLGYSAETQRALKHAYKIIYRSGLTVSQALIELESIAVLEPEVRRMSDFLEKATRGIIR
ncbi:MAG: acyl-ACP--UDP-N-acetylglucosamine O-acyltransferase [Gammaproteobacteria bacterium]|nr:acyl-ACP--UDP-N-acetylglucosamine O-acyltransferase [Gammaproteobacteria bacterium]